MNRATILAPLLILTACASQPTNRGPATQFVSVPLEVIAARFNEANPKGPQIVVSDAAKKDGFSGWMYLNEPENLVRAVGASSEYRISRHESTLYIEKATER